MFPSALRGEKRLVRRDVDARPRREVRQAKIPSAPHARARYLVRRLAHILEEHTSLALVHVKPRTRHPALVQRIPASADVSTSAPRRVDEHRPAGHQRETFGVHQMVRGGVRGQ